MTVSSKAWLLTTAGGSSFAVADHEMLEFVASPVVHNVPLAPRHCRSVFFWRGQVVPVMCYDMLWGESAKISVAAVAVLAYQAQPKAPLQYVAVAVTGIPRKIAVGDDEACELPESFLGLWRPLALACFAHNSVVTPILNVAYLCSTQFRDGSPSNIH